uniref:AN1-type domain-containing protein n=1 Tax=viral metagenome TaxID=1070528 RepID=A0A6C0DRX6_9ZZZZ
MSIPMFNLASLMKKIEANSITVEPAPLVEPKKTPSNRCECSGCKAKLNLADITCKCGARYCSKHRYPEDHKCTFDYKAVSQALLTAAMPKVEAAKMERI